MCYRVVSTISLGLFLYLIAAPLHAGQSRAPAAKSAAAAAAETDEQFLRDAEAAGLAVIQKGKLGAKNGFNDNVRAFAARMVTEHGRGYDELWTLADSKHIALESLLDEKARASVDQLSEMWGLAFDRAYAAEAVNDHQALVMAFRKQIQTSKDAEVKAWAQKVLPMLEEHLKLAQEAQKEVSPEVATKVGTTRSRPAAGK